MIKIGSNPTRKLSSMSMSEKNLMLFPLGSKLLTAFKKFPKFPSLYLVFKNLGGGDWGKIIGRWQAEFLYYTITVNTQSQYYWY